jgi:exosortase/archaeosortase family protein
LFAAAARLQSTAPLDLEFLSAVSPLTQLSSLWNHCRQEPIFLAAGVSLLLISLDFALTPALRNTTPLVATALLACLLARRLSVLPPNRTGRPISIGRVAVFLALHVSLIAVARSLGTAGSGYDASMRGGLLAAGKMLVLLPSAILLPRETWKRLTREFRPELVAVGVAFLTYYPFRIFLTTWPVYSKLLAHLVKSLAAVFVSGLGYRAGANPTITGHALDVTIIFYCSGIDGVRLFQILFGFLLVLDWDRLRRWRTLAGYAAGLATFLLANAIRITSMVVIGNRISADLVVRYHLQAGWIYTTCVFLLYLLVAYRWLIRIEGNRQTTASFA